MYNVVDPTDSRWLYNTRELNQMGRMDQKTGIRTNIAPTRPAGQPRLRYNWIAPIALSPHNPQIVYAGAQVLFRSLDRGDHWQEISPDLTVNDPARQGGTGNIQYATITTIDESPIVAGLIYVGTDDGNVQMTKNGGGAWTNVRDKLPGHPGHWVSRVEASKHNPGVAYVSVTGYRHDDFKPYLWKTTDFGDPVEVRPGEVPVFWACGVTPQAVAMAARPRLLLTHAPGHMFVTDLRDRDLEGRWAT